MPSFILNDSGGQPSTVTLPESGSITAGRSPDSGLVLADQRCSRRHFSINISQGVVTLTDLGSANGTAINGAPVSSPQVLHNGDVVSAAGFELLFMASAETVLPHLAPDAAGARGGDMIVRSVDEMAQLLEGGVQSALHRLKTPGDPYSSSTATGGPVATDNARFAILAQLARVILGSETSSELIESAVDLLFQVLRVQRVAIFLLNAEKHPVLASHRSSMEENNFIVSSTILERAITERVAITSGDARHDPRFATGQSIAAWDIRSVLCVPLWAEDEINGVLYLDNVKEQHAFDEADLELATGVSNLLAIGIRQHQLKERVKTEAVVRANLARYHSPDVVNMIISRKGLEGSIQAASEMEATILFSDIKGFTPLSERLHPAELAELLNWYFDLMTRIIFKHKGSVNKFIGDAVMAIFGAPLSHGDDAAKAVSAGVDMLAALEDFNAHLDERKRFQIRIGINTGPVIAGDIGARNRMEYTVIGDAVNTAQRLESICRPNSVTIGARTFELVKDLFKVHDLGKQTLKGKTLGVPAYEIIP